MSKITRKLASTAAISLLCASFASCTDDEGWPSFPLDGWVSTDAAVPLTDGSQSDVLSPDGLPVNAEGPVISIESPVEGAMIISSLLKVTAKIYDQKDNVDPLSVKVTVKGKDPQPMTVGSAPDTFEAYVDVSDLAGSVSIWIIASDLEGNVNSRLRTFTRDPGPSVIYLVPSEGAHFKGSMLVKVSVVDTRSKVESYWLQLGGKALQYSTKKLSDSHTLYTTTIDFDDQFNPPLTGEQLLTATALNANGASTTAQRIFHVDHVGPEIVIRKPAAGEVVGNVVELEAEITDPAGVQSTVNCVIGNNIEKRLVELKPTGVNNTYSAKFDTRTLTAKSDLWPVISFRAVDTLGNESHQDIQVGLDNAPPVVALPPLGEIYMGRFKNGVLECSHPFDPVGTDAARDKETAPQTVPLRVRIEDAGNPSVGAKFVPLALVDQASTWVYVLDDTAKALVVDTTGDGYCDSINPQLVPVASTPQQGQAVAVKLAQVEPTGEANFTPWANGVDQVFPFSACNNGTELTPPDPLCFVSGLTIASFSAGIADEPAIYTIPPVADDSQMQCLGLPFDFGANLIENGWACVAAAAVDNAGNAGISKPIRLWVDKAAPYWQKGDPPPINAGSAPNCTGTLDASGVVNNAKPCQFRSATADYPQQFPAVTQRVQGSSPQGSP